MSETPLSGVSLSLQLGEGSGGQKSAGSWAGRWRSPGLGSGNQSSHLVPADYLCDRGRWLCPSGPPVLSCAGTSFQCSRRQRIGVPQQLSSPFCTGRTPVLCSLTPFFPPLGRPWDQRRQRSSRWKWSARGSWNPRPQGPHGPDGPPRSTWGEWAGRAPRTAGPARISRTEGKDAAVASTWAPQAQGEPGRVWPSADQVPVTCVTWDRLPRSETALPCLSTGVRRASPDRFVVPVK